ncbi:phage tail protein [Vibrio alginolyticus]|uniref:phage tail protein n=1 Tax=Vibrio alginolyticus TaxID=663 RepID=UPI003754CD8B
MSMIHQRAPMGAQIQTAIKKLEAVKKSAVPAATARSINAVGVISERQTARDVSKSEKIKQRSIRQRINPIRKAKPSDPKRRVRVKRHDMAVAAVGKPRQTKKGVSVRHHRFPGAFVADGSKGFGKYIRAKHRTQKSESYYPTKLSSEQVLERTGRSRHPLEVITIPVHEPLTRAYERNVRRAYNQNMAPEMTKNLAKEMAKIR